ncbi:MAG: hypothetical protein ACI867_001034 [Glaciecola sp.]
MSRVTVHHVTQPSRLPLIEEEGLRTRADLSSLLGPVGAEDEVAPGRFAHGKRVSAFVSLTHAQAQVAELGGGLVEFSVDPKKVIAAPASARDASEPAAYWAAAKTLAEWGNDLPEDLEVHTNVPVRVKFVALKAPLFTDEHLGEYAPLVAAVADADRLSAKALMHLAVIHAAGDFESPVFRAACCLAWRDAPDTDGLISELVEIGPDKVASAALAEFQTVAPDAVAHLRAALEDTSTWSDENGVELAQGIFARTAMLLDQLG